MFEYDTSLRSGPLVVSVRTVVVYTTYVSDLTLTKGGCVFVGNVWFGVDRRLLAVGSNSTIHMCQSKLGGMVVSV